MIMIAWGTVMTLMGLVNSYGSLLACRILLGATESGLFPGIIENIYTGWPISNPAIRNFNISARCRSNGLKFLPVIEACTKFISIKTCLGRSFVKYHY
jgi:hypothetical protein